VITPSSTFSPSIPNPVLAYFGPNPLREGTFTRQLRIGTVRARVKYIHLISQTVWGMKNILQFPVTVFLW
jgi:hypothetical protein